MKKIVLTLFLLIPLFVSAQRKVYVHPVPDLSDQAFHLKKASAFLIGGTLLELAGAGLTLYGATQKDTYNGYYIVKANKTATYVGIGASAIGLLFQIVGYIQIGKAGKSLEVNADGLSFNF